MPRGHPLRAGQRLAPPRPRRPPSIARARADAVPLGGPPARPNRPFLACRLEPRGQNPSVAECPRGERTGQAWASGGLGRALVACRSAPKATPVFCPSRPSVELHMDYFSSSGPWFARLREKPSIPPKARHNQIKSTRVVCPSRPTLCGVTHGLLLLVGAMVRSLKGKAIHPCPRHGTIKSSHRMVMPHER